MKKFICLLLCITSLFSLAACSGKDLSSDINLLKDEIQLLKDENAALQNEINSLKEKEQSKLPDFKDCEIGYQFEVYPRVAFDYKVSEDCIVHIDSITATLTAKNVIAEGDLIDEAFDRFFVSLNISGNTASILKGKTVRVTIRMNSNLMPVAFSGIIDENGGFSISQSFSLVQNQVLHFNSVSVQ